MIQLTRLNGQHLIVNSDLIKLIENTPDTVLSLVNGEKIVVSETGEQVLERIVQFRRRVLNGLETNLSNLAAATTRPGNPNPNDAPPEER
jgi:flagellar protein FlbD